MTSTGDEKPMRAAMPETARFVDYLRGEFGTELIDEAIKAGLQGKATFYAEERGQVVGDPATMANPDRLHVFSDAEFEDMAARRKAR